MSVASPFLLDASGVVCTSHSAILFTAVQFRLMGTVYLIHYGGTVNNPITKLPLVDTRIWTWTKREWISLAPRQSATNSGGKGLDLGIFVTYFVIESDGRQKFWKVDSFAEMTSKFKRDLEEVHKMRSFSRKNEITDSSGKNPLKV